MSCRYDTATPSADPVHVSSIVVPGGYDLSTLNTTQVSAQSEARHHSCYLSTGSILMEAWKVASHAE